MLITDLEEELFNIFPDGEFKITTNSKGQVIIYTNLYQNDEGELLPIEDEEDVDSDEDPDFDAGFELDEEAMSDE